MYILYLVASTNATCLGMYCPVYLAADMVLSKTTGGCISLQSNKIRQAQPERLGGHRMSILGTVYCNSGAQPTYCVYT